MSSFDNYNSDFQNKIFKAIISDITKRRNDKIINEYKSKVYIEDEQTGEISLHIKWNSIADSILAYQDRRLNESIILFDTLIYFFDFYAVVGEDDSVKFMDMGTYKNESLINLGDSLYITKLGFKDNSFLMSIYSNFFNAYLIYNFTLKYSDVYLKNVSTGHY